MQQQREMRVVNREIVDTQERQLPLTQKTARRACYKSSDVLSLPHRDCSAERQTVCSSWGSSFNSSKRKNTSAKRTDD